MKKIASTFIVNAFGTLCGVLFAALITGCTSYRHERFADTGQPIELTTLRAPFLTKTALANLKTKVSDKRGTNIYTRSVGLDGAETRVDAEGVDAVGATVGRLLIEGLKASSGVGALVPSAPTAPRAAAPVAQVVEAVPVAPVTRTNAPPAK